MQLGIMINALDMSQLSYSLTKELNKLNSYKEYVDAIVFYHRYDHMLSSPHFAMLQEEQVWGFKAPVISTDLITARRLLNCPCPTKKFFYIWNLEWIYTRYYYNVLEDVYLNPSIHLIVRNEHHNRIVTNCWKPPVAVIEDFNHEQIIAMVKEAS